MAQTWCPNCHQFFAEDGFCPFDGTRLATPPETLRSASATERDHESIVAALRSRKADYDKLIGETLDGRYYIERKIGEGGMGVVFAARHAVIERPLAIKVLKREVARDPATIKRFVQEAKAATRVGHPCIVDVTDFGTTPEGMTYSVMEYVDGVTLSSVIKKTAPLALTRAIPIIAQIARALGAAHGKGIVHRDLKPENVFLVNRDGRRDFVKIVDFGIAKVTPVDGSVGEGPRLTRAGSVFGTPEYMAPEQAAGRPDTDQRVDVYALATILYEMLTGKVPHKSESMVRTLAMQMLDPIVPPSQARPDLPISPELERVVMKGLAKKREERYGDMADFLTDLERACPGIPTGVPAPEPSGPLQLVPAPPGADPRAMSGLPTVADGGEPPTTPERPTRPGLPTPGVGGGSSPEVPTRRDDARPTSKRVADPEFVTSQKPVTFDHVFEQSREPETRRSRAPVIALLIAGAAGIGVAAALVLRSSGGPREAAAPDAAVARVVVDAGVAAPDATVVAEVPPDAAVVDASVRSGGHTPRKKIDAGVPSDRLTPRGTVAVQVFSKPDGATIYVGDSYRGVSGVTLEEDPFTKVRVKCTLPGYDPGFADVIFDGTAEVVMCRPIRPKRCVDNLKNPFDDCPDPE